MLTLPWCRPLWMDGWMVDDGWMDGRWMDGWMVDGGWMDGWMDGWQQCMATWRRPRRIFNSQTVQSSSPRGGQRTRGWTRGSRWSWPAMTWTATPPPPYVGSDAALSITRTCQWVMILRAATALSATSHPGRMMVAMMTTTMGEMGSTWVMRMPFWPSGRLIWGHLGCTRAWPRTLALRTSRGSSLSAGKVGCSIFTGNICSR